MFTCTRKVHFWQLRLKFAAKYGINSYSNPENDEKIWNWRKQISKLTSRTEKRSLVNSAETRLSLGNIFSSPSHEKIWRTIILSKRRFLLRLFVYRREMQLQQTCQNFCIKSLNNSCSDLKKDKRIKIVQNIKLIIWSLKINFWKRCGQNIVESQIFFLPTVSPIMINET